MHLATRVPGENSNRDFRFNPRQPAMRRPTRTRRLSIAALASLLAFVVVSGAGVRSLWVRDTWTGSTVEVELLGARAIYTQISVAGVLPAGHTESRTKPSVRMFEEAWKFHWAKHVLQDPAFPSGKLWFITIHIALWPFLLLLLIIPFCWLVARPANAPAFPVVADADHR